MDIGQRRTLSYIIFFRTCLQSLLFQHCPLLLNEILFEIGRAILFSKAQYMVWLLILLPWLK